MSINEVLIEMIGIADALILDIERYGMILEKNKSEIIQMVDRLIELSKQLEEFRKSIK